MEVGSSTFCSDVGYSVEVAVLKDSKECQIAD